MMAARAMMGHGRENEGKVSACESYLPMGKLTRRVLRANGMERMVKLFHKRSDELHVGKDLDSRADVLVSEILDSELLGEGLIPTLQQAHDMLLVENPKMVPYRAITYGQFVESTFLWKLHDLFNQEADIPDGIHLVPAGLERIIDVKPRQYAMHCDAISQEIKLLSEPFKIFDFDLWKRPDSYREVEMLIKTTGDGRIHALISWWVLQLDCEGSVFYSTAPRWINSCDVQSGAPHLYCGREWCDHWKECVWFIPGPGIPVYKDKYVPVKAFHDDISISYSLPDNSSTDTGGLKPEDCHLILTPEKVAVYGDKAFRSAMSKSAETALQRARSCPFCVVADDSVFLTVLAASFSKDCTVISIFPGLQEQGTKYLQAVANANGFSMDCIEVVGKRAPCLLKQHSNKRKVDVLMGEPFYYGNEGMLPWQNLRFWQVRTMLDPILSEDAVMMPCKGILKACAMSLPDLWKSRCCLKKIEGFDHSVVSEILGACGELPPLQEGPCLPYFIWQCGEIKELSEVFSIMDFNFSEMIHACYGKKKINFSNHGVCHGFALWIDWVLDEREPIILSTGPVSRYWKQGVKLLRKPVEVNSCESSADIEASFNPTTGEITIKSSFS
ncbi:protein arginine N-methyltransferase 7 isoform X2 [Asparagus officinalis]|nr:protein arginine N-methyltransferase 7 isoform X2 [Asparagus officinalis]